MAEGDRTAIDVYLVRVNTEFSSKAQNNGSKSFIYFKQIYIPDRQTCFIQRFF